MSKHRKHNNVGKSFLTLDPNKMCLRNNNDKGTDISIIASINNYIVEVGRYQDDDADYLANHVKEILDYIQD